MTDSTQTQDLTATLAELTATMADLKAALAGQHAEKLTFGRADLAQALGVSEDLVDRLDASGKLPCPVKLGGRKLWPADQVRAWLAAGAPERALWEAMKASNGHMAGNRR